jgi:type VI secretion system protein VasD
MTSLYKAAVLTVCACGLSVVAACGAWQSVSDTSADAYRAVFKKHVKTLDIDLTARAALNPDEASRAVSVAVRVYQLKDRTSFDAASYADLLKKDRAVLGSDLLESLGQTINPGSAASLSQPVNPDTQFVGFAAFFRDVHDDHDWRRVIPVRDLRPDSPLKLTLTGSELVVGDEIPRHAN